MGLMRYGSNFGEWAVEDSDLDVVAVIYANLDSNEVKNALETAFLSLFYLQLWKTEPAIQSYKVVYFNYNLNKY